MLLKGLLYLHWLVASSALFYQFLDLVHIKKLVELLAGEHVCHIRVRRLAMNGAKRHIDILVVDVLYLSDDALRSFVHRSHLSGGDLVLSPQLRCLSIQGRVLLHLEGGGLRAERPSFSCAALIDPSHVSHLIGVAAPDLAQALERSRVILIVAVCDD